VFVRNLKAGVFHTITVPNRLIRLSPDGTILYSQRLTLTLACDMIFSNYPMDNQTCKIELGSCELLAAASRCTCGVFVLRVAIFDFYRARLC